LERLKHAIWLVWFGSLAAIGLGSGAIALIGYLVFWLTLVAHLIEFAVHWRLFERAGGSMFHHFVQTLIYGLFHWSPIKRQLEDEAAESDS
jgi:hypothetical protein